MCFYVFSDMLATGCEDKCVRIYYLATNSDQPLKVFTGKLPFINESKSEFFSLIFVAAQCEH